jgi:hypothetical protein
VKVVDYKLIAGSLSKLGTYGILRWCVVEHEKSLIIAKANEGISIGHYEGC